MSHRPDYCPIGNEPCQSMCETPCRATKRQRLTKKQVDDIIIAGSYHNAAGGIYASCIYRFAADIQDAMINGGELP